MPIDKEFIIKILSEAIEKRQENIERNNKVIQEEEEQHNFYEKSIYGMPFPERLGRFRDANERIRQKIQKLKEQIKEVDKL